MTRDDAGKHEELIIVARAVRVRGLIGELVAEVLTDFPERFEQISEMIGVAPGGERKPLELEKYWFQNDRVVLKFAGYDTVEAANELVGFQFGIGESERIELPAGQFYDWELEGCSVEVVNGPSIGTVREVMRTGGVELLVVEAGPKNDHLIPMADSIVVEIDVARKMIRVDPPEGLLDL